MPAAETGAGAAALQLLDERLSRWQVCLEETAQSAVEAEFKKLNFSGEIVTGADPLDSSVTAEIAMDSIVTGQEQRDAHIRSADFFDVENHPTMTYRSTGVRRHGDGYVVDGQLTLRGVTKDVPLALELNGFGPDPYGGTRAGFTATAEISRSDFGVSYNAAIEGGGVVVSDKVTIQLEIEAVLKA